MTEQIFRIRKSSGQEGESNFYHHADVIETHYTRALAAARQGRVVNWRMIDSFDTSDTDYVNYQYLGLVDFMYTKNPARPLEAVVDSD